MPELLTLSPEPILIRYEGLDAAAHQIDLHHLGTSLEGAARLLAVAGHIAYTGTYVSRVPAMQVRVLAGSPQGACYEIPVYLQTVMPMLPLLTVAGRAAMKRAVEAIVNYIFVRNGGTGGQVEAALDAVKVGIEANRDIALKALDVAAAVVKAAEDQRPAVRHFAEPVGETVETATVGEPARAFVVDRRAKKLIEQREIPNIGPAQPFTVRITELDVKTGSSKVVLRGHEADERLPAKIVDPVVETPRNPYSTALDSQDWLTVMAKPHLRDGELVELTIADTAV